MHNQPFTPRHSTHVVVDTIDGFTFWADADGNLFDCEAAAVFAAHRNAEMKPQYQSYRVFRLEELTSCPLPRFHLGVVHKHQSKHDPFVKREPGCRLCASWRHPATPAEPDTVAALHETCEECGGPLIAGEGDGNTCGPCSNERGLLVLTVSYNPGNVTLDYIRFLMESDLAGEQEFRVEDIRPIPATPEILLSDLFGSSDHDAAQYEGWDLFECDGSDNGPVQLQHIDDPDAYRADGAVISQEFPDDPSAWQYVMSNDTPLHRRALAVLRVLNPAEFACIIAGTESR